jgi:DNA-binding MarR family transcriptional regulator
MSEIFEGTAKTLKFLSKRNQASITELKDGVRISQDAIYNAIEKLKDAGLLEEKKERRFPRRRLLILTGRGAKVAEKLLEIDELMGG